MSQLTVLNFETLKIRLGAKHPDSNFILHQFGMSNAPKWEPCRMEVYFVGFLEKGHLIVESDLVSYHIQAPAIFAMAPSVVRKFVSASRNFQSQVVFFEKSFFLKDLSDANYLDRYVFFYHQLNHHFHLDQEQQRIVRTYFNLMNRQVKKSGTYSDEIVRNLLQILLCEIAEANTNIKTITSYSHNQLIVSEFKTNLEKHYRTIRKVSFYASLQNLSSKYFSGVIKQQTGMTAGELIDQRLILESNVMLQNKTLTIRQIAALLGFDDSSNFGKYFKNLTGSSPLNYRKTIFQ
jgi:AraC family transcriptional activator of pobA